MAGNIQPEYKYDLSRMSRLADYLGLMQPPHFTVHIAGTKGKGSVASMIASIIQANGYRVGLYTSPHLHTFRERIRINGAPISEALFGKNYGIDTKELATKCKWKLPTYDPGGSGGASTVTSTGPCED